MDRLNIRTKNRKFETAKDLYGIFFEDINRAGDGGIYPEMIRNRCFEDSLLPEGYTQRADGVHVVTDSGWEDEFNGGEGLSSWVEEDQIEKTSVPGWYAQDARMRLEQADTLNKNRKAALNVRFEKGGSIWNIGFCGIPQKKGCFRFQWRYFHAFYAFSHTSRPATHSWQATPPGINSVCLQKQPRKQNWRFLS